MAEFVHLQNSGYGQIFYTYIFHIEKFFFCVKKLIVDLTPTPPPPRFIPESPENFKQNLMPKI